MKAMSHEPTRHSIYDSIFRKGMGNIRRKNEGSVNVSAFIREKLFREEIKELAYYRELKNLTYQIRKIGVNINQVAAKINSGHGNIDSVFYLQKNLLQVEEEVKNLIEKLEEDRGNHKIDEH